MILGCGGAGDEHHVVDSLNKLSNKCSTLRISTSEDVENKNVRRSHGNEDSKLCPGRCKG